MIIDGNTVEMPSSTEMTMLEQALWLNENTIALYSGSKLFFYLLPTDELILVDDFSGVIPAGKDGVYYGISTVIPSGEGCLFFAFDMPGHSNGHLYYVDLDSGRKDVVGGATFGGMFGTENLAFMQTYTDTPDGSRYEQTDLAFYTGSGKMGEIPPVSGWAFYFQAFSTGGQQRILFEGEPNPGNQRAFYVYEISHDGSGILSSYSPEIAGMYQYELITVRGEVGTLEYVFSARNRLEPENPKSYLYSEKTKQLTQLEKYIPRYNDPNMYASTTHYIEFLPDWYDAMYAKVSEIN